MAQTVVPDDVILEVLANLPVKSLLRFKSVCKTWYSTISDPEFCNKLHRKRPSILICENSEKFSTITIESLLLSTTKNNKAAPTPLPLPWETESCGENYFIGSCNGMVCVCVHHIGRLNEFILWNPSTRKFRKLPICLPFLKEGHYQHYVWFGYDESIHDYKLVWLNYFPLTPVETELYVFTLKSNTWRRRSTGGLLSEGGLYQNGLEESGSNRRRILGVLSGGAIHWRAISPHPRRRVIVALDLATENFQVLDFANYPFDPRGGGSCLVGGHSGRSFQIVKEYGRRRSETYFPILFSSGKEIVGVVDSVLTDPSGKTYVDAIIKFRIEEGGEKVTALKLLLDVRYVLPYRNNIVLHMAESLLSLT